MRQNIKNGPQYTIEVVKIIFTKSVITGVLWKYSTIVSHVCVLHCAHCGLTKLYWATICSFPGYFRLHL